jgi:y4mF family transcriptional regulator
MHRKNSGAPLVIGSSTLDDLRREAAFEETPRSGIGAHTSYGTTGVAPSNPFGNTSGLSGNSGIAPSASHNPLASGGGVSHSYGTTGVAPSNPFGNTSGLSGNSGIAPSASHNPLASGGGVSHSYGTTGVAPSKPSRQTEAAPSEVAVVNPADLGALIRAARQRMHLSQQAFADVAGVGRRFVSELEHGKATLEIGLVLRVCIAAGVNIHAAKRY